MSADPSSDAGVRPAGFSAWETVSNSYRFLFSGWRSLLSAIWLPTGLAAVVLIVLFKAYFAMLARFFVTRDLRVASVAVSLAIVGFLVWLLLNVIASARVARLMDGRTNRPPGATTLAVAARLFAAALRCLLVLFLPASLPAWTVLFVAAHYAPSERIAGAGLFGAMVGAALCVAFIVRCGLLVPALVQFGVHRVLRRSWQLTRGHFWKLLTVWAAVAGLPAVLLQVLGEFLTRRIVAGDGAVTMVAATQHLAADNAAMAGIVISVTLSTGLYVVLTTIASCMTYPALIKR